MRLLIVLAALIAVTTATSVEELPINIPIPGLPIEIPLPTLGELNPAKIAELFAQFMTNFGKKYANPLEQANALVTFGNNVKNIIELNAKVVGDTVQYGINQFSDLTDAEFASKMLTKEPVRPIDFEEAHRVNFTHSNYASIPSFDWRKQANVVGPVRDQGSCGCCWAFAAAGLMQSAYGIKNKKIIQPSEQQLCDCGMPNTSPGCNGGNVGTALKYAMNTGISLDTSYTAYNPTRATKTNIKIKSYKWFSPADDSEMGDTLFTYGPIVAIFKVGPSFRNYKSGIFISNDCDKNNLGYHWVQIVGYGGENGIPYWIVKNSWGTSYGESGYVRFLRGDDLCTLESLELYYATA